MRRCALREVVPNLAHGKLETRGDSNEDIPSTKIPQARRQSARTRPCCSLRDALHSQRAVYCVYSHMRYRRNLPPGERPGPAKEGPGWL